MNLKNKRILNLGCGFDIMKNAVNLDCKKLSGVDIVHNLEETPLPFPGSEFAQIFCTDVIEHVSSHTSLLKELHRILTPGGTIHIRVPHFTSANNYSDPTHKNRYGARTFCFFVENQERGYYFDFHFKKIISVKIELFKKFLFFGKRLSFWLNYVEKWINSSEKRQWLYEDTGLCRIFPAANMLIVLKK